MSENVFNFSARNITESEIKLLSKSLGFVAMPEKVNRWQFKQDHEKFGRNTWMTSLLWK